MGWNMCRSVTLDLIHLVATEVSTDRALDLMWTGVEFRRTQDLVEGLILRGACRAEEIYSTSCMCTRCGTGCVEQHRRMAREQEREDSFVWGEELQAMKGHRMRHLFSCSTSLKILTRNKWRSVPLASREDCRKQPPLRTDTQPRGPSTGALPVLTNKAHFSFSVLGNWGCSEQVIREPKDRA